MKRQFLIEINCGDTTCRPCELRDVRWIGCAKNLPYCVLFKRRLRREKVASEGGFFLNLRCRRCLEAEWRTKERVT
jgi:hypothetical protein